MTSTRKRTIDAVKINKFKKHKNGCVLVDLFIDTPVEDVVKIVAKTIKRKFKSNVYRYDPHTQHQLMLFCFATNKTLAVAAIADFFNQKDLNQIRPSVKLFC